MTSASQAPNSVVIADFNEDGKPDIASANFGFNTATIALGDGVGGFGTPQTTPSAFGAISVATGDFNGDNHLDLAVADTFNHQVWLSLGIGNGGFNPSTQVNVGSGPNQVVTGDFNLDGKLDFATANFFENSVSVFLGNGAAGFTQATGSPFATAASPRSLRIAKLNGDDNPDIAVASELGKVTVLLGNGSGSFAQVAGSPISVEGKLYYVDSADFNGDGNIDLATAGGDPSTVSILFGNGTGSFSLASTVPVGATPRGLSIVDLTGDGKPEIVSANFDANSVTVLLNGGAGGFVVAANVPVGFNPRSVAAADLNNDGKPDLAVANTNSYNISILLGSGGGVFTGPTVLPVAFNPALGVAVGDYNGDGRNDVAAGNAGGVSILLASNDGSFNSTGNFGFGPGAFVITPDLNFDGKLDLVKADGAGGDSVQVMLGNGDGSFGPRTTFTVGTSPMSIALGDFNNDGNFDLATSNYGSSNLSILIGNGLGGFAAAPPIPVFGQTPFVAVGDFNNDGKSDLVGARLFQGDLALLLGDGAGNFSPAPNILLGTAAPSAIAMNDFNGDGHADIAAAARHQFNSTINFVTVLLGTGNGTFSTPVTYAVAANPVSIAVADFNSDGDPDLVTANKEANNLSILLGDGVGGFGAAVNVLSGQSPSYVAAADMNGDGRSDLLAGINNGVALLPNLCTAPPISQPTISIGDITVTEGSDGTSDLVFTVGLSAPSDKVVSVGFNTFGITAASGSDFQSKAGRLFFGPGITTQTITVSHLADTTDEFDETFGISLKEQLNATMSDSRAIATILDDDAPPTASLADISLLEGNSGATSAIFTVALSAVSGKPITLQFATMDGSATSADYVAKSGTVSIPAGNISTTITVQVIGDTIFEPDEIFVINVSNPDNVEIADGQGTATVVNDDPVPSMSVDASSLPEGQTGTSVRVRLSNASYLPITVAYATSDSAGLTNCNVVNGVASSRCDYATSVGRLSFAAGETFRNISVPVVDDSYAEGNESFTITLSDALGALLGTTPTATVTITDNDVSNGPNPIDGTPFFVRQQYVDFLGREPDPGGFAAWQAVINNCPAGDTTCDRIHVSSGFFRSPEFQGRGYFVYRLYPVAFGRKPEYVEFIPDLAKVSGFLSDAELEAARVAFIAEFMSRPAFVTKYNGLSNTQYVDTLLATAGITHTARDFWIASLGNGMRTRAQVLREIVESTEVYNKYYNQAFVVMQYFGYLRRDPDALYLDWIQVLETTGDFRGMVNGFMNSLEYRFRFGP